MWFRCVIFVVLRNLPEITNFHFKIHIWKMPQLSEKWIQGDMKFHIMYTTFVSFISSEGIFAKTRISEVDSKCKWQIEKRSEEERKTLFCSISSNALMSSWERKNVHGMKTGYRISSKRQCKFESTASNVVLWILKYFII